MGGARRSGHDAEWERFARDVDQIVRSALARMDRAGLTRQVAEHRLRSLDERQEAA